MVRDDRFRPRRLWIRIGVADREGQEICIGDRLRFDAAEWGEPHEFTVDLAGGQILPDGSTGDLSEWCEVIDSPGAVLLVAEEEEGGAG